MSWEAWGDDEDSMMDSAVDHLLDAGWWDGDTVQSGRA